MKKLTPDTAEENELHRLLALAVDGDLDALDAAVELAERMVLIQLTSAPSGARER
ncbi:hypothetical protein SAMN04489798_2300 [Pseudomonas arsenicoxydans]|uniref:Uncharacterized protein n=1 Tax=Pseudomonas arsenicoxydans TaxID=702115 RepID=A0A1H0HL41_9PSED|nr:hypothetical protein SAMN04489798_2300 [Pseudomonas arsenicoxydans]